jgi:hypothetical protein
MTRGIKKQSKQVVRCRTNPTLSMKNMGDQMEAINANSFAFKLDSTVVGVEDQLQIATTAFKVTEQVWTTTTGRVSEFLPLDDDHDDEEDFICKAFGPNPIGAAKFFEMKVRHYITRAMKQAVDTKTCNIHIEEFMEDPFIYRRIIRDTCDPYFPAKGTEEKKRMVQEIDYRNPTAFQFNTLFGEIEPVKKSKYWVLLHNNSVRFYYRKDLRVGALIDVMIVYDY